jgi:hypothetical protein
MQNPRTTCIFSGLDWFLPRDLVSIVSDFAQLTNVDKLALVLFEHSDSSGDGSILILIDDCYPCVIKWLGTRDTTGKHYYLCEYFCSYGNHRSTLLSFDNLLHPIGVLGSKSSCVLELMDRVK